MKDMLKIIFFDLSEKRVSRHVTPKKNKLDPQIPTSQWLKGWIDRLPFQNEEGFFWGKDT